MSEFSSLVQVKTSGLGQAKGGKVKRSPKKSAPRPTQTNEKFYSINEQMDTVKAIKENMEKDSVITMKDGGKWNDMTTSITETNERSTKQSVVQTKHKATLQRQSKKLALQTTTTTKFYSINENMDNIEAVRKSMIQDSVVTMKDGGMWAQG
jgi:type II secretory pathway component PulC